MELLEKYFAELIQCIDASYLVIGIILVFLSVPDTADYAPYRKAKYFLASAFFVMFIDLYLWLEIFSSQDWEVLNSINACMDISLFFLTGICFAYSFASLLDSQYINKKEDIEGFRVLDIDGFLFLDYPFGAFCTLCQLSVYHFHPDFL